eukprot:3612193-Prymnesium_polylepis.2
MTPPTLRRNRSGFVASSPPTPCPSRRHIRRTIVVSAPKAATCPLQPKTPVRPLSRPPQARSRLYRSSSQENWCAS